MSLSARFTEAAAVLDRLRARLLRTQHLGVEPDQAVGGRELEHDPVPERQLGGGGDPHAVRADVDDDERDRPLVALRSRHDADAELCDPDPRDLPLLQHRGELEVRDAHRRHTDLRNPPAVPDLTAHLVEHEGVDRVARAKRAHDPALGGKGQVPVGAGHDVAVEHAVCRREGAACEVVHALVRSVEVPQASGEVALILRTSNRPIVTGLEAL